MSELIVIGYEREDSAEAARASLLEMQREYLVSVADAVVATRDEHGKVRLNQMVNLWTVGASGGAFWGLLAGLLFFNPLLGLAAGAGAGALAGALSDYGIEDGFMKEVAGVLQPGQAALFVMMKEQAPERVIERLSRHGGRVLRTNLDRSKEEALRRAFEEAQRVEAPTAAGAAA